MEKRFNVAPMMAHTNRHFRYFWRLISKKSTLFTEMIAADELVRVDKSPESYNKYLGFDKSEQPVILQIGGRDPTTLVQAAKLGLEYGYSGINLNCGCPSGTVAVEGAMGASMMLDPLHTAYCCAKLVESVGSSCEVSVKCRIGVDDMDSYEQLHHFIHTISTQSNIQRFQIHARKAILGIGALANRDVPPLRYDMVHRLVKDFPSLAIEINGGIVSPRDTERHLRDCPGLAGVMIGRACVNHPYLFTTMDQYLSRITISSADNSQCVPSESNNNGNDDNTSTTKFSPLQSREDILQQYMIYCESYGKLSSPSSVALILAPVFNMFMGERGADHFRRKAKHLVGKGVKTPAFILRLALQEVPDEVRHSLLVKDMEDIQIEPWVDKVRRTSAPMHGRIS
eukprot:gene6085-12278_t